MSSKFDFNLCTLPSSAFPFRLTFFMVPRWGLQFYNNMETWQYPGAERSPFFSIMSLWNPLIIHPLLSHIPELYHLSQCKTDIGKGNWMNCDSPPGLGLGLDPERGSPPLKLMEGLRPGKNWDLISRTWTKLVFGEWGRRWMWKMISGWASTSVYYTPQVQQHFLSS